MSEAYDMARGEDYFPSDPIGTGLEDLLYTLDGELIDTSEPSVSEIVRMVEYDSQAQAMELALSLPLQQAPLIIEARPGGDKEAQWLRERVIAPQRGRGMKTPWQTIQNQHISALTTKRQYWELTYKRLEDGKICYDQVAWRPPSSCSIKVDDSGEVQGFIQRGIRPSGDQIDNVFYFDPKEAEKDRQNIEDDRARGDAKVGMGYVYIHRADKKPAEGVSAFQTAYYDYKHKLKNMRLLHLNNQRYALGTVVGTVEATADEQNNPRGLAAAVSLGKKIKNFMGGGGWFVESKGESVRIEAHNGAASEFLATISFHNTQMVGSGLMRFLQLGTESSTGSWALSTDQTDFFLMSREAAQSDMAASAENGLFAPLIEWNFGKNAVYPQIRYGPLSTTQQQEAMELYKTLVIAASRPGGDLWDAITEKAMAYIDIDPEKWKDATTVENPDFAKNRELLRQAVKNGDKSTFEDQATGARR